MKFICREVKFGKARVTTREAESADAARGYDAEIVRSDKRAVSR